MTHPYLSVVVRGSPAPQGSKRGFVNKRTGSVSMVEMSKKVAPWREAVKHAALVATGGYGAVDALPALDCPVWVEMVFSFARPANHYRTGRNAHLLRDAAPTRPTGAPDLSKLARATEDALTDAGVWKDDARVVEYRRLAKVYAHNGDDETNDPDVLDTPGVVIRIYTEEP